MEHNIPDKDVIKIFTKLKEDKIPSSSIDGTLDLYMINENLLFNHCKAIDICYNILSPYNALLFTQFSRGCLFQIFPRVFANTFEMPSICK